LGALIYASIDAYSRFITWFYVGISSSTSRSVVAQYLDVLSQRKTMPNIIRSDRGQETILMAGAHYYLSKTRVRAREGIPQDVRFRDCWIYGKSTHNEKIESWWLRLSRGRAKFWREYFGEITALGHFSNDSLPDRIAMLYLFMPILRAEFADFVLTWNSHYIRKQRNRPHVVPGQPWTLYFQPTARQVESFAEVIPQDRLQTLQDIFDGDRIDLDAYLPEDTIAICDRILRGQEDLPRDPPQQPKLSAYLFLRDRLRQYIRSKQQPELALLETPTGGLDRVRDHLATHDIDTASLLERIEEEEIDWGEGDQLYD
ncbi:hypothetical protein BGZ61DRAFT_368878, partial [Ilyonectria robusta]|uniref:uncharacterized protein n=1 Tax=Ilyonectria robusta TaxID=1079257 RepID=UPI001E8EA52D